MLYYYVTIVSDVSKQCTHDVTTDQLAPHPGQASDLGHLVHVHRGNEKSGPGHCAVENLKMSNEINFDLNKS